MDNCFFCGSSKPQVQRLGNRDAYQVQCSACGIYLITGTMIAVLENDPGLTEQRHLISGLIRDTTDRGGEFEITDTTIEEMVSKASPPRDPLDALDRLLLRIHASMADPLEFVVVPKTWYSVVYGKNDADLDQYIGLLTQLNLIEGGSLRRYRPTLEGWQRLRELRADTRNSNQAFVAMWFTPEMMTAWREGFEPALRAVGFDPIRIDLIQHNEKIDDRIIAEIRRSGLLVADFTRGRGGVYFEAGFALGLGRPVIWTCREDWVDKLHFDTRQYNHITWAEPRELRETLQARIEATVPGRARTIT